MKTIASFEIASFEIVWLLGRGRAGEKGRGGGPGRRAASRSRVKEPEQLLELVWPPEEDRYFEVRGGLCFE